MPADNLDPTANARAAGHPFSLRGRVALITGGAQGLGFEIAAALHGAGATVLLAARNADRLAQAVQRLGAGAHAMPLDINDEAAVTRAVEQAGETHGRLDILVNNAGARNRQSMAALGTSELRAMMETNLIAPYHLCRLASAWMQRGGYGRIINVSSIAGQIARANDVLYPATKGALDALTRALAADLGGHGITVNAIAPGYFATEANRPMVDDQSVASWLRQRTSLGRWGEPAEIAGAAVFLASPAASYITGHVLAVDGGYLGHF